jgi:hypothetical protein
MRVVGKWFSSFIIITMVLLAITTLKTEASGVNLPIFYKGIPPKCEYPPCGHAKLFAGPNGTVYQEDPSGQTINAIDASGKKLWTYKLPEKHSLYFMQKRNADAKGNYYVEYEKYGYEDDSKNGEYLASINSKGQLNWEIKIHDYLRPHNPVIGSDGTVYVGAGRVTEYDGGSSVKESKFYAISSTGKLKWTVNVNGDSAYADTYFDANSNIVVRSGNFTYTISREGKVLSTKSEESFYKDRLYYDQSKNVYSVKDYKLLTAKDKNGRTLWSYKGDSNFGIVHVSASGTVYLSTSDYVISVTKGKINWKTKADGTIKFYANGIYVEKYVYDPKTYARNMVFQHIDLNTGNLNTKTIDTSFPFYSIHPKGFLVASDGNTIYKLQLLLEPSSLLRSSQIKISNNKGKSDIIQVSGLTKGQTVKVYNSSSKGLLLATRKAVSSTVSISIKQLAKTSGKVYITSTSSGKAESKRLAITFGGEQSDSLKTSKIKITNNKKKSDSVKVSGVVKGDTVKVYNASSKGKLLVSKKSKGSTVSLTIKQLGKKSGKVYVTVTKNGMQESKRVKVTFKAEKK